MPGNLRYSPCNIHSYKSKVLTCEICEDVLKDIRETPLSSELKYKEEQRKRANSKFKKSA